jgi:hypothetical protein
MHRGSGIRLRPIGIFITPPGLRATTRPPAKARFAYSPSNVRPAQAAQIEAGLELKPEARLMLLPGFQDVVEVVLGESVKRGQPKGTYIAKWWVGTP